MNYNKVIIGGHLTRDPELRYSANETALCNFGVAVNEERGDTKRTDFFEVTAFGKTAPDLHQ